jgi:hypothetical protein
MSSKKDPYEEIIRKIDELVPLVLSLKWDVRKAFYEKLYQLEGRRKMIKSLRKILRSSVMPPLKSEFSFYFQNVDESSVTLGVKIYDDRFFVVRRKKTKSGVKIVDKEIRLLTLKDIYNLGKKLETYKIDKNVLKSVIFPRKSVVFR